MMPIRIARIVSMESLFAPSRLRVIDSFLFSREDAKTRRIWSPGLAPTGMALEGLGE
jgi:hypothetical protein